jgi:hypothetical protein
MLKQALKENQVQIYDLLARSQDRQDFRTHFYHTHHAIQTTPALVSQFEQINLEINAIFSSDLTRAW